MNLTEALPKEIERVRETVLPFYKHISGTHLAVWMMEMDLDQAQKALESKDSVEMTRACEALQGWIL